MTKSTTTQPVRTHLYWVTDGKHDEDWFVIARNLRSARTFYIRYEGMEGCDDDFVQAEQVLSNIGIGNKVPRHAQVEDLQHLGFKVLGSGDRHVRQVKLQDRIFTEGGLESLARFRDDNKCDALGLGRPNGTEHDITRYQMAKLRELNRSAKGKRDDVQ